ncbi:DNA-binding protein, partial [Bacteroides uniformis]
MELLTRNNFENWMQKVMERLDRQDEMLLSMQPSGKAPNPMDGIRLFDNQDLCM